MANHLTSWDVFTHEHMVPGGEVHQLLIGPSFEANRGALGEL
ncbi:hypothetical protein [Noviherbaspirillum autotrophicum]|nr:hypothetical protein [Noviherbaspirillum autotrophicum]